MDRDDKRMNHQNSTAHPTQNPRFGAIMGKAELRKCRYGGWANRESDQHTNFKIIGANKAH